MRNLDRDRVSVWVGRYLGKHPVEVDGKFTGRNEVRYSEPVEFFPTISATRGEAENDYFGQKLDYDRTLTIDDDQFAINEGDVLWVEKLPMTDDLESVVHDYIVKRVARTSSYTVVAASQVDVSK